jgi:hypothetical protein
MAISKLVFLFLFSYVAWGQNNQGQNGNNQGQNGNNQGGNNQGNQNDDDFFPADPLAGVPTQYRDVCIVGGGAAGTAAAIFLTDNNYSVLLVEKEAQLGGHCDTVNFPAPPGFPFGPTAWLDIGVAFHPDTAKLNAQGFGPWDVSNSALFARFHPLGAGALLYANLSAPSSTVTSNANFNTGTVYGTAPAFPPANPSAAYLAALAKYTDIVTNQYHWISLNQYPTNWYPDRIPNDLLQPFASWLNNHNLTALLPLFQAFLNPAGVGNWETVPAIWCVLAIPPSILQSVTVPDTGFVLAFGCQPFYTSVQFYLNGLGTSSVLVNSQVTYAKRRSTGWTWNSKSSPPVTIDVQTTGSASSHWSCGQLIVAHPQTTTDVAYLNLDILEEAVLSQVQTRYYFNGVANITGGTAAPGGFGSFSFRDEDTANAFAQQDFPGLISLARSVFPFGPAQILGSSSNPMTNAQFASLAATQIAHLSPSVNASVWFTNYHQYQPYPVTSGINHPFGFYTQLQTLQGHRNTYYIGALASYAGTYLVWEQAFDLIAKNFPPQ